MAPLIYNALTSLDGYSEDENGHFDWAAPDADVHRFINDLVRGAGTFLYGRRMYETMQPWESDPALAAASPITRDFAGIWQSVDKIVFSRSLATVSTRRTTLVGDFDPAYVRQLKEEMERVLYIGGPDLAGHAFRAGLVDGCQLFVAPVIVGGGKRTLPDAVQLDLELVDERRFASGFVFLHYRVRPGTGA